MGLCDEEHNQLVRSLKRSFYRAVQEKKRKDKEEARWNADLNADDGEGGGNHPECETDDEPEDQDFDDAYYNSQELANALFGITLGEAEASIRSTAAEILSQVVKGYETRIFKCPIEYQALAENLRIAVHPSQGCSKIGLRSARGHRIGTASHDPRLLIFQVVENHPATWHQVYHSKLLRETLNSGRRALKAAMEIKWSFVSWEEFEKTEVGSMTLQQVPVSVFNQHKQIRKEAKEDGVELYLGGTEDTLV